MCSDGGRVQEKVESKVVLRVMRIILWPCNRDKDRGFSSTQEIDLITGNKLITRTQTRIHTHMHSRNVDKCQKVSVLHWYFYCQWLTWSVCVCVSVCVRVSLHVGVCVMKREHLNLDQKWREGVLPSTLTFIKSVCLISQPHHTCALQSTTTAFKAPLACRPTHTQRRECPTQDPLWLFD